MSLIRSETNALLFACLLLAAGIFAPVSAQTSGGGADLSRREVYEPVVERDRTTRYRVNKHFYKLKEEDVGTHDLTVRVREGKAGGEEQVHDVASFTLDVQPEGSCVAPTVEVLYPKVGDVVYDILSTQQSLTPTDMGTVSGVSSFTGAFGGDGPMYNVVFFNLTVTQATELALFMPEETPEGWEALNDFYPAAFIFRDDDELSLDDYVTGFGGWDLLWIEGTAEAFLQPGSYLIAVATDSMSSEDIVFGGGVYQCFDDPCDDRMDITFELEIYAPEPVLIIEGASTGGLPPDYRPITVKASAPSGIDAVVLGGEEFGYVELDTDDGVIYTLDLTDSEVLNFYKNGLFPDPPPSSIGMTAISVCGASAILDLPLNIQPDPAPTVSLSTDIPLLQLNLGEQTHLPALIADAGRNVSSLHAVLFAPGTIPDSTGITPGNYSDMVLGEVAVHRFFEDISGAEPLSVDSFRFQLPVTVAPEGAVIGDYDLRLLAFDSTGQAGISGPLPVTILPSTVPAFLDVDLPEFRIPAGESAPVTFKVESLGPLDVLKIQATGAAFDTAVRTVDLDGAIQFELKDWIRVADSAEVGDYINLTVTAVAQGGLSSSFMGQIEVGEWGERTIVIDENTPEPEDGDLRTTADMSYANLVIDGVFLEHADSSIRFNRIEIEAGGTLSAGRTFFNDADELVSDELGVLDIREALVIHEDGELRVDFVESENQGGASQEGGSHGGDSYQRQAYGSVRLPKFPGASGSDSGNPVAGGGRLEIVVPLLMNDGTIRANGLGADSGFLNGVAGAGGSLLIRAQQLQGGGLISANGGQGQDSTESPSGAGGRIAIYYDTYNGGTDLLDGMTLEAYPGQEGLVSAPGTIFLKASDQAYGELIINAIPEYGGYPATTLPGVGRHTILAVNYEEENLYRISVPGTPWNVPDDSRWEAGLVGLQISLDADNPEAPLYTILDNDENSFIVESDVSLLGIEGRDLIGVYRFDRVVFGRNVHPATEGRLRGAEFQAGNPVMLDDIADLRSDEVHDLGHYVASASRTFVGNVNAESLTMSVDFAPVNVVSVTGAEAEGVSAVLSLNEQNGCTDGVLASNNQLCSVVWYDLQVFTTTQIVLETTQATFDTYLRLFNAANFNVNAEIAFDDDSGVGTLSRISRQLTPGNYILAVGRYFLSSAEAVSGRDTANQSGGTFTLSMLASGGGSPFGTGEAVTCTPGTVAAMEEPCSVLWYEFNISESSNVRLEAISGGFDTQMYLFDANNMTSSYLAFDDDGGEGTLSRIESVLAPGRYVLAVGEKQLSAAEALAGVNSGSGLGGPVAIEILAIPNEPQAVIVYGDLSVEEQLDMSGGVVEVDGSLQSGSITLAGESLLSVSDNASVAADLAMTDSSNFSAGDIFVEGAVTLSGESDLDAGGDLTIQGALDIDNTELEVEGTLTVNNEVNLDNQASLIAENVQVGGGSSLLLASGSTVEVGNLLSIADVLSVSTESLVQSRRIQANIIQLDGGDSTINDPVELIAEEASAESVFVLLNAVASFHPEKLKITLSSGNQFILAPDAIVNAYQGASPLNNFFVAYPECSPGQPPQGSHGGLANNPLFGGDCVYDRYDRAETPGSSYGPTGMEMNSGAVKIVAESVSINGTVLAHGDGRESTAAFSGGSIHVEAGQLIGSGSLQAYGYSGFVSGTSIAAGGGRIVILADNSADVRATPDNYPSYAAYGGVGTSVIAGAGTVLIANRDLGRKHLIVDNNGATAAVNSTPIRSVGRHNIALVAPLGSNLWEVSIAGSPWKPSDSLNDTGLAGRYVSLDADNPAAPLYRIVSNTASTLVVEGGGSDIVYGTELIGVHEFETLDVKNGAYVDFGDDRVIVNDPDNSQIDLTRINASPDSVFQ